MEQKKFTYDVALSFAGEDRDYVEEVAILLRTLGIKVFYDKFEEANLWGKNLYEYLNEVYKEKAKYTVMFISRYYKDKLWTNHERRALQERAFEESKEYILPARFDDTEIPGLGSTTSYIDLRNKTPKELVKLICEKIGWISKKRWWGEWNVESSIISYQSTLKILKVFDKGFEFEIKTSNGAHSGEIEGFAEFKSEYEALFSSYDEYFGLCRLKFFKFNDIIQVDEDSCFYYHGQKSSFNGDYKLKKDIFYEIDFVNDIVLTKLYSILGDKYWKKFLYCFGDVYLDSDKENYFRVIKGGVPGCYSEYEAILLIDRFNELTGAFLYNGKIYYFTTLSENKNKMPDIINEWQKDFAHNKFVVIP